MQFMISAGCVPAAARLSTSIRAVRTNVIPILFTRWFRAILSGGKMRLALPYAAIVWCIAVAIWIALGTAP